MTLADKSRDANNDNPEPVRIVPLIGLLTDDGYQALGVPELLRVPESLIRECARDHDRSTCARTPQERSQNLGAR